MGLRKAGLVKDLPSNLIGTAGEVHLVDAQGLPFDHLRAQKKGAVASSDGYFETLKNAAITINAHHGKGDMAYNQGKLDAAEKQRKALKELAKSGTSEEKAKAAHYLALLDGIKAAIGDQSKQAPQVTPFAPGTPAAAPVQSLVQRLAAHMQARGGDWKHVQTWAEAQAGSSQSELAKAYKRFLLAQLDGAKEKDFFQAPAADALSKMVPAAELESYRRAMTMHHAFVQEVLGHTLFATNDQALRRVRILRTETKASVIPFAVGEKGLYKRGVNESGSLIRPIWSGGKTISNVPHSRVTSLYFLEQRPGSGGTFLLGDSENEATYISWNLEARRVAEGYLNTAPGTDSTKWEI